MKLTFLGTGTSYGVPLVGCECQVCRSTDPADKRLRACILVEDGSTRLMVDTGPDFRQQCLRAGVHSLSAVLWTHLHNDHIIGLDDIRPFSDRQGYIAGYADEPTANRIQETFDYIFVQGRDHPGFPRMNMHIVHPGQSLRFGEITVTPLRIMHGQRPILAYQFEKNGRRLVYATDCSGIPDETMEIIKGCNVFVVDALRQTRHPNHFSLAQAIQATHQVNPGRAFLTHITHELPHQATQAELPLGISVAYDQLALEV